MTRLYDFGVQAALQKVSSYRPLAGSLRAALQDAAHAAAPRIEGAAGAAAVRGPAMARLPGAGVDRASMYADFMPPGRFQAPAPAAPMNPLDALRARVKNNV